MLAVVVCAFAASCPGRDGVAAQSGDLADGLFAAFMAGSVMEIPAEKPDMPRAREIQARYVELLVTRRGPVTGYKAGLTNPVAQERFGIGQPVRGTILRDMLIPSPARLRIDQGARLAIEADLLVRVRDASINQAASDAALLAALDAVIPFLEVPDLVFPPGAPVTAELLVAANVGARFGVTGKPMMLHGADGVAQGLSAFSVVLTDAQGRELARGKGRDLLGGPVNVVRWLRDDLVSSGITLRPGDLLSLGSLTRLVPAQEGATFHARYEGLDPAGTRDVTVRFAGRADE